jgi:hypothetical protein
MQQLMQKLTPRTLLFFGIPVVIILLGWTVFSNLNRDQKLITRRLETLRDQMSFASGESNVIQTAATINGIRKNFTENFILEPGDPLGRIDDPDRMKAAIFYVHRLTDSLELIIHDSEITIGPSKNKAVAEVTVEGIVQQAGRADGDTRVYTIDFEKIKGDWYIKKITTKQAFRRPE